MIYTLHTRQIFVSTIHKHSIYIYQHLLIAFAQLDTRTRAKLWKTSPLERHQNQQGNWSHSRTQTRQIQEWPIHWVYSPQDFAPIPPRRTSQISKVDAKLIQTWSFNELVRVIGPKTKKSSLSYQMCTFGMGHGMDFPPEHFLKKKTAQHRTKRWARGWQVQRSTLMAFVAQLRLVPALRYLQNAEKRPIWFLKQNLGINLQLQQTVHIQQVVKMLKYYRLSNKPASNQFQTKLLDTLRDPNVWCTHIHPQIPATSKRRLRRFTTHSQRSSSSSCCATAKSVLFSNFSL